MRGMTLVCFISVVLLGTVMLAPAAGMAKSDTASAGSELERILGDLEDVVMQLQLESSLNAEEVSSLRRELAVVYRDLTVLQKRLAADEPNTGGNGHHADAKDWQPYPFAKNDLWPSGAKFNGWRDSADVSFSFGKYGEIILSIDNFDYQAKWTINNAYRGQVEVRVNSTADGAVVLNVKDEDGEHEFMVSQGGLGALSIRGRDGYRAPGAKSASN
jgi:hypothetical protein